MAKAATPHPIDAYVGARLRIRRKSLGLSQQALADALGLTFQQVQKYERAGNRVSASKLHEMAKVLKVPVAYFFEGFEENDGTNLTTSATEQSVNAFLVTTEGLDLARLFPRIASGRIRRKILELVRALAGVD
ncbi:helix-turn-helix domain-containing protein [Asticcacaulis taihuensis]|jgi:transcriptional regulator with XRE-family HTH domain|uniref:helix-turn-helix domain-containing protein n=1 Tax=Asticcacaulis taihuensis TaxID=260084 RepID=UPI0026EA3CCA|nr:helix-turn-helix transcriptional regulator [Asticcacaulis taihuensis]